MKVKKCSQCGEVNRDDAINCLNCNGLLTDSDIDEINNLNIGLGIACPQCKSLNLEQAYYCQICGSPIQKGTPSLPDNDIADNDLAPTPSPAGEAIIIDTEHGCYICGKKPVKKCKRDGKYFCEEHGYFYWCNNCLEYGKRIPIAINIIGWFFYILALITGTAELILIVKVGSSLLRGNQTITDITGGSFLLMAILAGILNSNPDIYIYILLACGLIFVLILIPVILYFYGNALRSKAGWTRWVLVLLSALNLYLGYRSELYVLLGIGIIILIIVIKDWKWFDLPI